MMFHYAKEEPWVFYMFVAQTIRSDSIPQHIKKINQIEQLAEIIQSGQKHGYFREGNSYTLAAAF